MYYAYSGVFGKLVIQRGKNNKSIKADELPKLERTRILIECDRRNEEISSL